MTILEVTTPADFDVLTKFCDMDNQAAGNSVWVMLPAGNNVPTKQEAEASYYQIPAIRCIGTTGEERNANIDRQRRNFPQIKLAHRFCTDKMFSE